MEKKGIIAGYQALIDLNALDYKFYKGFFYLTDATKIKAMNAFAMLHPNIVFLNRNIGGADFELEFHVKEIEEFKNKEYKFLSGAYVFNLESSLGIGVEIIQDIAKEKGIEINMEEVKEEEKKHQEKSRAGANKKFGGDNS